MTSITTTPTSSTTHLGFRTMVEASAQELISSCQPALSGIDSRVILDTLKKPGNICERTADVICAWAKRQSKTHHIPEKTAFQLLLREIKKYDLHQLPYAEQAYTKQEQHPGPAPRTTTGHIPESTFALRNSILFASQKSHVDL